MKRLAAIVALLVLMAPLLQGEDGGSAITRSRKVADWKAADGVTHEGVMAEAPLGRCIRITGTQEGAWNYLQTEPFKVLPGARYRMEAWLLIETPMSPPPYFSVEFTAQRGGEGGQEVSFGQVVTDAYDFKKGGRQFLTAEFETPDGAGGAQIALEKGTQKAARIDAFMGVVTVEEIEDFSAIEKYALEETPEPLESLKGVHPRLHLTEKRVNELRELVKSDDRYASMFAEIRAMADRGVESGPPKYVGDDGWSGIEQLYQRGVGEMMPHIALCYLMTGEKKYLDSAGEWMRTSCGYETWGLPPFLNNGLPAGHQLYGLAVSYDWLYHDLDEETKRTVRECFADRADFMFRQAATGQAWWHNAYLQNHLWVNTTGLAAAGFAVYGEVEGAEAWIALPLEKYRTTFKSLGPDGASHEGVPYWTYGIEYMMKFMDLCDGLLGEDFFAGSKWFENTAYFRLYSSLPTGSWARRSSLMSFADSPRWDWYGPDNMLRKLASKYNDPYAQWLAGALDDADVCGMTAPFLNLIWYDPDIDSKDPSSLPTFRHFEDMGLVYMRSDWSGGETLSAFKCGAHIGREALEAFDFDPGGGHVHPDAGSFQIFSHGDWLMVDDGYTWKTTEYQNTVVVNGIGQEGEGRAWFAGGDLCRESRGASMIAAAAGQRMDYAIGDVTDAYRREAGLRKFIRHFYYVKPATWVVIDELEAAEPSTFDVYFHGEFPFEKDGNAWRLSGEKGSLSLTVVEPADAASWAFKQALKTTGGSVGNEKLDTLKVSNPQKTETARFVTVISAYPSGEDAPVAKLTEAGLLEVASPGGTLVLRLDLDRRDPAAPAVSIVE